MNTYIPRLVRVVFSLLIYPTIGAADVPENGKLSLTLTPRLESVQQTGRQSSSALTLGTNLGYTHTVNEQFSFSVEVEDTRAADEDSYNPAGLNPRSTNRAVVADPTGTEINQAWVSYQDDVFAAKIGRQALVLNNARFIGNVGWRQNMQTFDAIQATATSAPLKFTYAYLNQINRILGDDHPAGQWDSDSHLLNLDWKITDDLQLTGYSYLLSFDNAAANNTATHGVFLSGSRAISDGEQFIYRAEYALQRDARESPLNYEASYSLLEVGFKNKSGTLTFGREILGEDQGVGFKTPLATGHAFNGWADLFLGTPGTGLEDLYVKVTANLPQNIKGAAVYHDFASSTDNQTWGHELDLSAARSFGKHFSVLLKYADFDSDSVRPDVTKFWLQTVYRY